MKFDEYEISGDAKQHGALGLVVPFAKSKMNVPGAPNSSGLGARGFSKSNHGVFGRKKTPWSNHDLTMVFFFAAATNRGLQSWMM